MEFLGYEGTRTAANAPAAGMTALNIGVSESGDTPQEHARQLCEIGAAASHFIWQRAAPRTANLPNTHQTFEVCADAIPSTNYPGLVALAALIATAAAKILCSKRRVV